MRPFYSIKLKRNNKTKTVLKDVSGIEYNSYFKNLSNVKDGDFYSSFKNKDGKVTDHKSKEFNLCNDLIALSELDIEYDCSIQFSYNCTNYTCSDYCRCGVISSFDLNKDPNVIFKDEIFKIIKPYSLSISENIKEYIIDRCFSINPLTKDSFEMHTMNGYYGEELKSITLCSYGFLDLYKLLSSKSDVEAIKEILNKEYGYLLDSLKNINKVDVLSVNLSDCKSRRDYSKIDKSIKDKYIGKYDLPIGIYIESNKKYALIDGNHRLQAAKEDNKETVDIIVLKD